MKTSIWTEESPTEIQYIIFTTCQVSTEKENDYLYAKNQINDPIKHNGENQKFGVGSTSSLKWLGTPNEERIEPLT